MTTLCRERLGTRLPKDVAREIDIGPRREAVVELPTRCRMGIEV